MTPETERRFRHLLVERKLIDPARLAEVAGAPGDQRHLVQRLCEAGLIERTLASAVLKEARVTSETGFVDVDLDTRREAPPAPSPPPATPGSETEVLSDPKKKQTPVEELEEVTPLDESSASTSAGTAIVSEAVEKAFRESPLGPGTELGPYKILSELGRGGMGIVFRALDRRLEREVALKTIAGAADADVVERFLREARAAAKLRHPGVVSIFEANVYSGVRVLALELVDGGSLAERLRKSGAYAPRDAATLVRDLALAVEAAHAAGIVHRDLKPGNVLLEKDGRPRLTDFGLARAEGSEALTQQGAVVGTPAYMSPEQAVGDHEGVGPASDVWALGAILYEMLSGRPPFTGKNALQVLRAVTDDAPPPLADAPPELARVCLHALEKDPDERIASARALADALTDYLEGRAPPEPARRSIVIKSGASRATSKANVRAGPSGTKRARVKSGEGPVSPRPRPGMPRPGAPSPRVAMVLVTASILGCLVLAATFMGVMKSEPDPPRVVVTFSPKPPRRPDPPVAASPTPRPVMASWTPLARDYRRRDGGSTRSAAPPGGFTFRGEPDASWVASPGSGSLLFGAASATWKATGLAPSKNDEIDHPVGVIRASADSVFGRDRAAVLSADRRTLTLVEAGSEATPRHVALANEVSVLALAGSRVLCVHPGKPFLTVVDSLRGEVEKTIAIPQGAASSITVNPSNPRLAVLLAGGELVGFDAARNEFLESWKYTGNRLYREGGAIRLGGDGRYLYAWRPDISPMGVIVLDAQQAFAEVFYEHSTWRIEPDAAGRFVCTTNGIYRAGFVERVSPRPCALLGTMTDGNLLVLEAEDFQARTPAQLAILDGKTADPLRHEALGLDRTSGERRLRLLPGTNRLVASGQKGYVFRDLEPATATAAPAGRLAAVGALRRDAPLGETWSFPVNVLPASAAADVEVSVKGPAGMKYDPAAKAVVWRPTILQRGEHAVAITLSTKGHDLEDLTLTEKVTADYRVLRLTRATSFGVTPLERWLWWGAKDGEITFMDAGTKETTTLGFDTAPCSVTESEDRVFVAFSEPSKIVELDAKTLAPHRERPHRAGQLVAIAAHPTRPRLLCLCQGRDLAFTVSLVSLDNHDKPGTVFGLPWSPPRDFAGPVEVRWLDAERFAIACPAAERLPHDASSPRGQVFRLGEDGVEAVASLAESPTAAVEGEGQKRLYLGPGAIVDESGALVKQHTGAVLAASLDRKRYAAIGLGREDAVAVSQVALPDLTPLDAVTFEIGRRTYANRFSRAFFLSRWEAVAAQTTTTFTDGIQVWFLPVDAASWGK